MVRSASREAAMKLLYAYKLGGEDTTADVSEQSEYEVLSARDETFCKTLVDGVKEKDEELRKVISAFTQGWNIDRLGKVELCLLEIATYEILYMPQIPLGASVNEAIELAKIYCDEKSPAFLNGILGAIGKQYRSRA